MMRKKSTKIGLQNAWPNWEKKHDAQQFKNKKYALGIDHKKSHKQRKRVNPKEKPGWKIDARLSPEPAGKSPASSSIGGMFVYIDNIHTGRINRPQPLTREPE
jgi:hypothetical protein